MRTVIAISTQRSIPLLDFYNYFDAHSDILYSDNRKKVQKVLWELEDRYKKAERRCGSAACVHALEDLQLVREHLEELKNE